MIFIVGMPKDTHNMTNDDVTPGVTEERKQVVRVLTTKAEKQELRLAAFNAGMPVATFTREAALEKARSEAVARPDWASFFARKIHPDVANWEFEREQFEDRDVFTPESDHR
jgi:hypothetical protein